MSMKNPLTPSGIEPATFRFVAQPTTVLPRSPGHVKLSEFTILEHSNKTIHMTPILPSRIYWRVDIPKNKLSSCCEWRLVCEPVKRGLSQHHCRNLTCGTAGLHLLNAVQTKLLSHVGLSACVTFYYTSAESTDVYLFLSRVSLVYVCKSRFILNSCSVPCVFVEKSNVPIIKITRPYCLARICYIVQNLAP